MVMTSFSFRQPSPRREREGRREQRRADGSDPGCRESRKSLNRKDSFPSEKSLSSCRAGSRLMICGGTREENILCALSRAGVKRND
jgi:hypothetical protein